MITQTHFRSVVLTEHGPVFKCDQLLEVPRQETFIVVRPLVVGVCSSDVKEVSGVRPHRRDFGHEIVGTVMHTNMNGPLRAGDRVVYDPHVKLTRNSGFSEFVIASSRADWLEKAFLKVAGSLHVHKLVFLEPMACIVHAFRNLQAQAAGLARGLSMGIVGAGNAGTLAALYGKHLGLGVTLMNRSEERLGFLRNARIFSSQEMALVKDAEKNRFDIVLLATSFLSQETVELGMNIVRDHGVVLLYGGTTSGTTVADTDLDDIRRNEKHARIRWQEKDILLIGTHGALRADFVEAYDAVRMHPENFPFEHLITLRIGLEDLPRILTGMSRNPDHCTGKTVVDME